MLALTLHLPLTLSLRLGSRPQNAKIKYSFEYSCTKIDKLVRQFARYKSLISSDAIGLLFSERSEKKSLTEEETGRNNTSTKSMNRKISSASLAICHVVDAVWPKPNDAHIFRGAIEMNER